MIQTKQALKANQQYLRALTAHIKETCDFCHVGSDPTRLKILYLLKRHRELCVTDLADCLLLGISAISHQLSLLERCGMVKKTRMGKNICYSLDAKSKAFFHR